MPVALMAESNKSTYIGRPVSDVIDEYRAQGHSFAYSTNLVGQSLLVTVEPNASDPLGLVQEILAPHQLTILQEHGFYLIVRKDIPDQQVGRLLLIIREKANWTPLKETSVSSKPALTVGETLGTGVQQFSDLLPRRYQLRIEAKGFEARTRLVTLRPGETTVVEVALEPRRPELEEITVSASRYDIWSDTTISPFFIDQRSIQLIPTLGDDPLRAIQRLPGSASSGVSARTYVRGGEQRESGIILNGHRLFDPFHVRDFQNIFSTIDPRAIEGIEVHTGGFPARYGDQMSAMVVMNSVDREEPPRTELGVSLFNTSFLNSGNMANGRGAWLFSARRGNLDLIIRPEEGSPSYYDIFGEFSFELSPTALLSANTLVAEDRIEIILANDDTEVERASSDTSNLQFWLRLQNQWSNELTSSTLLSFGSFSNERLGLVDDPEKVAANIDDVRDVSQFSLKQDWGWHYSDKQFLQWGFEFGYSDASYHYKSDVEFVGLPLLFPGIDPTAVYDLRAAPSGGNYSVYVSDKWKIGNRTFVEAGLRWDNQEYTDLSSDPQISPRLSFFHGTATGTEYRISWGRYFQSQGIHELQIEDGVTEFFRAQQSDHLIAGVRQLINNKTSLRIEVFQKTFRHLRPRFENVFDPLQLLPEIAPDRVRLAPASAEAKGVEFMLSYGEGAPLSWWASYTLSEVKDEIGGSNVARSWDQTHAIQGGLSFSSDQWDFGLAANIHTGWPTTLLALDGNGGVIVGPRNAERFSTFATLDARVSRRFTFGDTVLTTFFELSNAFDRRNPCCVDFDLELDDAGNLSLDRQEENWLPLLPAIGFLLEF